MSFIVYEDCGPCGGSDAQSVQMQMEMKELWVRTKIVIRLQDEDHCLWAYYIFFYVLFAYARINFASSFHYRDDE